MAKRANGEGSIYRRADGRWCASLTVEGGRRKAFYGERREDVARKLAAALKARQDGLPLPAERQTVTNFLTSWLEGARPSLRPRTHQRYEELIRLHTLPDLGRLTLTRVTPNHLQRLYAGRLEAGQSPASVRQLHAILHKAFGQAARWGLVARNVVDLVSGPRVERHEMQALSPEQARDLVHTAAGDRLEALYVLAITTGMRQGELLALHWRDVDLEASALHVRGSLQRTADGLTVVPPKTTRSRRQVALTVASVDSLRKHRAGQAKERLRLGAAWDDHDLVFPNGVGRPLDAANLMHNSFRPLLKQAGLPRIRFHDLRHTAATLMLGKGVHPKVVAEMLGHSQISITLDLYSHVTPTMQKQATEALDAVLQA